MRLAVLPLLERREPHLQAVESGHWRATEHGSASWGQRLPSRPSLRVFNSTVPVAGTSVTDPASISPFEFFHLLVARI